MPSSDKVTVRNVKCDSMEVLGTTYNGNYILEAKISSERGRYELLIARLVRHYGMSPVVIVNEQLRDLKTIGVVVPPPR